MRRRSATSVRRRGGILLEVVLSLALFSMASLAILSILSDGASRLARGRDMLVGEDLARTALSLIEAGIATPESLNGPIEAGLSEAFDGLGGPTDGDGFDDSAGFDEAGALDAPLPSEGDFAEDPLAEPSEPFGIGWALEIEAEISEYPGLTLVSVTARRESLGSVGGDVGGAVVTLRQLVRLSGEQEAGIGDLGELGREAEAGAGDLNLRRRTTFDGDEAP